VKVTRAPFQAQASLNRPLTPRATPSSEPSILIILSGPATRELRCQTPSSAVSDFRDALDLNHQFGKRQTLNLN
jgi:hypothetical protein